VTHSDFVLVDSLGIKVVSLDVVNPLAKPLCLFGTECKPNDSFAHRLRFARISSVTGRAAGDASILCLQLLCFDIYFPPKGVKIDVAVKDGDRLICF